jgi:hypothetical protein
MSRNASASLAFAAALGLAAAFALPQPAFAQADVLTAKKLVCLPEKITRCKSVGVDCESKEATARDKTQPLTFDLAGKKGLMRRNGSDAPVGDVTEDKVEGDVRVIVLAGGGGQTPITFRVKKDGKTEGSRADGQLKMEISCTAG